MRLNIQELQTLRLALTDWITEQEGGATTPQEELASAEKLWQKLTREAINRKEKEAKA